MEKATDENSAKTTTHDLHHLNWDMRYALNVEETAFVQFLGGFSWKLAVAEVAFCFSKDGVESLGAAWPLSEVSLELPPLPALAGRRG